MSALHEALADYLSIRRAMGYKLEELVIQKRAHRRGGAGGHDVEQPTAATNHDVQAAVVLGRNQKRRSRRHPSPSPSPLLCTSMVTVAVANLPVPSPTV